MSVLFCCAGISLDERSQMTTASPLGKRFKLHFRTLVVLAHFFIDFLYILIFFMENTKQRAQTQISLLSSHRSHNVFPIRIYYV